MAKPSPWLTPTPAPRLKQLKELTCSNFTENGGSYNLSGESKARGDTRHGGRHKVVEIAVGGRRQLECAEADVIQSLVVDAVSLVGVLNQLVNRQSRVVRLHHRVRDLPQSQHTCCQWTVNQVPESL